VPRKPQKKNVRYRKKESPKIGQRLVMEEGRRGDHRKLSVWCSPNGGEYGCSKTPGRVNCGKGGKKSSDETNGEKKQRLMGKRAQEHEELGCRKGQRAAIWGEDDQKTQKHNKDKALGDADFTPSNLEQKREHNWCNLQLWVVNNGVEWVEWGRGREKG